MDDVRICKICGNLIENDVNSDMCYKCFRQNELKFKLIKEYLIKNPNAQMYDVSTDLNISLRTIKNYLRRGRLFIVEKNNRFLTCEKCGKPIQSGRYCSQCLTTIKHDYHTIYLDENSKKNPSIVYNPRRSRRRRKRLFN